MKDLRNNPSEGLLNTGGKSHRVYNTWLLWGYSPTLVFSSHRMLLQLKLYMRMEASQQVYLHGWHLSYSKIKQNCMLDLLSGQTWSCTTFISFHCLLLSAGGINSWIMWKIALANLLTIIIKMALSLWRVWLYSMQHRPSVVQDFSFPDFNKRPLVSQTSHLLIIWVGWNKVKNNNKKFNNHITYVVQRDMKQLIMWACVCLCGHKSKEIL